MKSLSTLRHCYDWLWKMQMRLKSHSEWTSTHLSFERPVWRWWIIYFDFLWKALEYPLALTLSCGISVESKIVCQPLWLNVAGERCMCGYGLISWIVWVLRQGSPYSFLFPQSHDCSTCLVNMVIYQHVFSYSYSLYAPPINNCFFLLDMHVFPPHNLSSDIAYKRTELSVRDGAHQMASYGEGKSDVTDVQCWCLPMSTFYVWRGHALV